MKIKNENVTIKTGKKQYELKNLILNEYLCRFVKRQINENEMDYASNDIKLKYCLLKFEEPIEDLLPEKNIKNSDFDVCLMWGTSYEQIINEKEVIIQYDYSADFIWDYNENQGKENGISDYYGKKITAIGFNSYWANDNNLSFKVPVCAVLDISNYNIFLQEKQELSITRRDTITTDAFFYSNDKKIVPGPVHLAPCGVPQIIKQPNIYNDTRDSWRTFDDPGYGILYSIGLSSYKDYIDKEFVIKKDIQIEVNDSEINVNGLRNYLTINNSKFPIENIYANTAIYPVRENYKYIIFKYKVWQNVHSGSFDNVKTVPTDTGYYYYQAIPIDKFGKINLKIKYERG